MKQFLEYIPLIFFLIVYKMDERMFAIAGINITIGGIFSATAVLIALTVLCYGALLLLGGSLSRMQWIVVIAVVVFGSSTLLLRSEEILKWKAPVVNWIIGGIFLGSQFIGETNMAKSMFGHMVTMPQARWNRLNLAWVGVFLTLGTAGNSRANFLHLSLSESRCAGSCRPKRLRLFHQRRLEVGEILVKNPVPLRYPLLLAFEHACGIANNAD